MDSVAALSKSLAGFGLALALACGGGGGSEGPTPPSAPQKLTAIGIDRQVSLAWDASTGATSYNIKRGTSIGSYTQLATSTATTYRDTGLNNGTTYFYVVSALSSAGEGSNSAEVSATPSTALPLLPEDDATKNHVGMNTWFLNDWDESFAFVDAVKHARAWQDGANWNTAVGGIDDLGWPTADASTVFWTGTPAQVNGTYRLSFKGQADVSVMWYGGSVSNKIYDSATNTTTADVTISASGSGSGGLRLTNTKRTATSATNTGFTDLHLYRPGYATDGSDVFTSPFLAALGKVSVVRMMDWTATNSNLTQNWSDRRTPLHMYKAGPAYNGPGGGVWSSSVTGVALEHQIQLCNALKADFWVNIPVVADDDYVRKIALACRYGTDGTNPYTSYEANPVYPPLDPTLHVYLEYANEIWNSAGGFTCFGVIHDIVGSLPADHPLLTPTTTNIYFQMWRYPAYRMAAISDIFRSVYGDASMMNRVRPLLMTQQGSAQMTLEQALTWLDVYAQGQSPARTVGSYLYGAGGSGYYGVNAEPAIPSAALDQTYLDAFFTSGNYPATVNVKGFGIDSLWAGNYGLKHIAYEGGPSLDSYDAGTDYGQAMAINADARMQDMVVKTHEAWSNQGGDLLVYYALVGPSKWEFTPDITNTSTPKFKALDQLNGQSRASVTLGQALPGSIIASDWRGSGYQIREGYDYATTIDSLSCVAGNDPGEWVAYPAHSDAAFTGSLSIRGKATDGTTLAVWLNGVRQGEVTLPSSTGLTDSTGLSVSIPKGLAVIRLENVGANGLALYSVSVN